MALGMAHSAYVHRIALSLLIFLDLWLPLPSDAKLARSSAAKAEFKRENPCPANAARRGSCPGYIIDHVIPLCAGGPDATSNMQWQTVADAKAKDRIERRECRRHG